MEVEYIIEKLGEYLGGIDVERVKKALGNRPTGVERILGIVAEEEEGLDRLECMRIKTFIDAYKEEERRLVVLYRELKTSGVAPSDMASLKRKIKHVKRQIRIYREMGKRCQTHQGRSVTSRDQTPEFTSQQ
ncbi:MAG: hypothetical protein GU356_07795 [Pyrobaculum sp.]|jgi:hypothetical protein|nr:hypothetical protein [Pyrobaculum sp.]